MTDDDDARRFQQETIVHQLYKLSLSQTEAIMQLSHALRMDQNVSENTRDVADKTWEGVKDMIGLLRIISKIYGPTDPQENADE